MSSLLLPERGDLIATLVVYERVLPLARPRMRYGVKGVYQPLANQQNLRSALASYAPLKISFPVIIDTCVGMLKAKRCKTKWPVGRLHGDEDNLRKAINDALIDREILTDDKLILGGENFKFFSSEDICVVRIFAVASSNRELTYV